MFNILYVPAFILDSFPVKWEYLASMNDARYNHACGTINHKDVLVAGGMDYLGYSIDLVEILSLVSLEWRAGTPLPDKVSGAVSIEHGSSLMIIGGVKSDENTSSIYQYIESQNNWAKREELLQTKRDLHIAIKIPGKNIHTYSHEGNMLSMSLFYALKNFLYLTFKKPKFALVSILPTQWTPWGYMHGECPKGCYSAGPPNQKRRCLQEEPENDNGSSSVAVFTCPGPSERRRRCDMGMCNGEPPSIHCISSLLKTCSTKPRCLLPNALLDIYREGLTDSLSFVLLQSLPLNTLFYFKFQHQRCSWSSEATD